MITSLPTRFCIAVWASSVVLSASANATPIGQVVVLLKDLSNRLAAEGQNEAKQYDKFACFCKDEADKKQYSIEKTDARIKHLKAEVDSFQADETKLDNEILELNQKIQDLEDRIQRKREHRQEQHTEYLYTAGNLTQAIDACSAALASMKNSKKQQQLLSVKFDFVQVTSGLVKKVKSHPLLAKTPAAIALLSQFDQQATPTYKVEYQSGHIIDALENLHSAFIVMKNDLDNDEHWGKKAFEQNLTGLSNEKRFAEQARDEKAGIVGSRQDQIGERRELMQEQDEDRRADSKFMSRLSNKCQEAAATFDQNSQTRAAEITAITQAARELEAGAVPSYMANKKLVGLQKEAHMEEVIGKTKETHGFIKDGSGKDRKKLGPTTFLQMNSAEHKMSRQKTPLKRVSLFLSEKADETGSPALSAIAARVGLFERKQALLQMSAYTSDHFQKVRGLIEDLIEKLRADMLSEAGQKHNCDVGIQEALNDRDKAKAHIELANAALTVLEGNKNTLEQDHQEVYDNVAQLKKAAKEAQELATEEIVNLNQQIEMLKQGIFSVESALDLLKGFYSVEPPREQLVETSTRTLLIEPTQYALAAEEKPAHLEHADRNGNTVEDVAPSKSPTAYSGAHSESKGIMGILEVVLDDFKNSLKQADEDKEITEASLSMFLEDVNSTVVEKNKKSRSIQVSLVQINEDAVTEEQARRDANTLLEGSMKALESWHSMCVEGEETWEERKQKRDDEVNALKQALTILEEWQSS